MSLPTFPTINPPISINESLNMILASIAMEELGLSHIINAEGEKLQYVLGTLETSPDEKASVEEILSVNKSIKDLLDSVMQNQIILKGKMEYAIGALQDHGSIGPTGPQGPAGPTGAAGVPGSLCAISFRGCTKQRWDSGKPLTWKRSECSECSSLKLAPDCKHILLENNKYFVLSFSIDLRAMSETCRSASISVQTVGGQKWIDRFICHVPAIDRNAPFTASAGGIFISTHDAASSTALALTLLTPDSVWVNHSSICVREI